MALFTLTFDVLGGFGSEAPNTVVYYGGVKVSQFFTTASLSSYSIELDTDSFDHAQLFVRFLNSGTETGRSVTFSNMAIDGTNLDLSVFDANHGAITDTNSVTLGQGHYSGYDAASDLGLAPAIMLGTENGEKLYADDFGNEIDGLGGNDTIYGRGGNDILHGGEGDDAIGGKAGTDILNGGLGNDRLWGGQDDDILHGGEGNDRLQGDHGDDQLFGDAGDDLLYGGAGNDILHGGDGNDNLRAASGDNELYGDAGNDKISGGEGQDTIYGGDGHDTIHGWNGNDTIYGGIGKDTIAGDNGDDIIFGEDGDDVIYGGEGSDTLHGGEGNDGFNGHAGEDVINGDAGNDILNGGEGNDTLNGGDDNDYLYGEDGDDTLDGGAGDDVLYGAVLTQAPDNIDQIMSDNPGLVYSQITGNFYQYIAGAFTWDASNTAAQSSDIEGQNGYLVTITSQEEQDLMVDIVSGYAWTGASDINAEGTFEWLDGPEAGTELSYTGWYSGSPTSNSDANDHVLLLNDTNNQEWYAYTGTYNAGYVIEWTGADVITVNLDYYDSSAETNTLNGGSGNDQLFGSEGIDILDGGLDDDLINGGSGIDTVRFQSATGGVNVNLVTGTATGNGSDTLSQIENVEGTSFADVLRGDGENNVLNGYDGNDQIFGGSGDDILNGGDGNDTIYATTDGGSLTAQDILSEFSFLSYSEDTGNFYQYISTGATWGAADSSAQASVVNGVAGHLVTITSAQEQNFLEGLVDGYAWTGGGDSNVEGAFEWMTGIESGQAITYTNWYGGGATSTSNNGANDHILLLNDNNAQQWYAYTENYSAGYVIEWDGASILANGGTFGNGTKLISGGDGLDTLYGGNGLDTFIFESANAFNDVDVINGFDTLDGDALDISDLLSGFTAGSSDITDFVQINNSGANAIVSVDVDGAVGGSNFQDVGQLNGLNDIDVASLYASGNIIA